MPTNRTPISRRPSRRITPRAVEIFKAMLELPEGEEHRRLDHELHAELQLMPWQGPALVRPGETPSHPPTSTAGQWQREGGSELFKALREAGLTA
jgi:hypothetical protein